MTDQPDGCFQYIPGAQIEVNPEFAQPWVGGQATNVLAGGEWTYTYVLTDTTKIYQINSVSIGCTTEVYLFAKLLINGIVYWSGGNVGYIEFPCVNNPSIKLTTADTIQVYVLNGGATTTNVHIDLNGTMFKKPAGFGTPPISRFSLSPSIASVGSTITFTSLATGTITSYDWDYGDSTTHGTSVNPTHDYTVAGSYDPSLTVTNSYGNNVYGITPSVGIADIQDLTTYTEVDPVAFLTVLASNVAFALVLGTTQTYLYADGGANYFDTIDISFHVNVSAAEDGALAAVFLLSNAVSHYGVNSASDLRLEWIRSGANHTLVLTQLRSTGATDNSVSISVVLGDDYYIRIKKNYNSTSIYYYIYSDSTYTTLYSSGVLSCTYNKTVRWRYLYPFCSQGVAGAAAISGTVYNLRVISPS